MFELKFLTRRMVWNFAVCLLIMAGVVLPLPAFASPAQNQQAAQGRVAQQAVGVIKAISGNTITLKPDAGADVSAAVSDATRIVRVAPGQTDLKNAAPLKLGDLQTGDRILVRGNLSGDGKSIVASGVIAMKRSDVDAKQQRDRDDWQKRGIGGIVSGVDVAAKTITLSLAGTAGGNTVTIHVPKEAVLRRYAPDSVQFDDAKPSTLEEIKPGDQVRARGARSADGSEFAAEEIVSGAFRNIAGLVTLVDKANDTVTVNDLITKKSVLVKVTPQSQVVKLTPPIAQGIAARAKGAQQGTSASGGGAAGSGKAPTNQNAGSGPAGSGSDVANAGAARQRGAQADLQQVVNRMPKADLADFQKGDAVMIVSTEGTASGGATAILLLGGVEPILAASPAGSQSMTLSPWSIGGGGGDAGEPNQ